MTGTATVTVNVTNIDSDLVLNKAVAPTMAAPGATITYSLTFSNDGGNPANGVVITDYIPISVTVQNVISSGDVVITRTLSSQTSYTPTALANGVYTWTVRAHDMVGNISTGLTAPFTISATATSIDTTVYLPIVVMSQESTESK